MENDYTEDSGEVRPNENKSFSYVMSGQMFIGDTEVIRVEPKRGVSLDQVEMELRRDFRGLRIAQKDLAKNLLYIQGTPNFS